MSNYICFLLTILNNDAGDVYRVAIKINREDIPETAGDVADYPMEPENKQYLFSLLPDYAQGRIIEVVEIFEVVTA